MVEGACVTLSLYSLHYNALSLSQHPLTAPSRREPYFVLSSAYINKAPTNRLIGLWELFVAALSPLRTTEKALPDAFITFPSGWIQPQS